MGTINKTTNIRNLLSLFAIVCLFTTTSAIAQSSIDAGQHVIHYNALTTDNLAQQTARVNGIRRSMSTGMLNISVIKKDGGVGVPVTAKVTATSKNLSGQIRNLSLRKIEDSGAIYYISEFPVRDKETLKFSMTVTPENSEQTSKFTLSREFYVR